MGEDCELLFFDTFSHESCEELNLDLVQFPRPLYIYEIRVIPLGARVQADFPGGHRLGATNPSSFQLEFFVNDLSKRSACTFERLGILDYKQNVEIQFPVSSKIPTDGLVLRGLYSAVTLAIYGVLTKTSTKERSSSQQVQQPPPPPPPMSITRSHDHIQVEHPVTEKVITEWETCPRPVEPPPPEPVAAIHHHNQQLVEGQRFDIPQIIHPKPEPHAQYAAEMPQSVYPDQPPPIVYSECIPTTVPSVPPPVPYTTPYDANYPKPWPPPPPPGDPYHARSEGYDPQVYNRPPDTPSYLPPTTSHWEPKECHPPEMKMSRQEHDPYDQQNLHDDQVQHSRNKDRRDKPWDRDSNSSDYIKEEDLSRDRDYKRKERDRRSWERSSSESDRYRDRERDRMKDNPGRERERSRNESRDKLRSHDGYSDRVSRPSVKRPFTPPSPPLSTHMPQSPPELDKPIGGPRTPKEEEPHDSFEETRTKDIEPHDTDFYGVISPERTGEIIYNLSEGEIQEGDNTEDDDGYEEIVSEEEIMSDGEERVLDIVDIDYDLGDETWNYMSSFSPYHCELTSCQYFDDPTLTPLEIAENRSKRNVTTDTTEAQENKLLETINQFEGKEQAEKWVESLESLSSQTIIDSLLAMKTKQAYDDAVDTLIDWVVKGLNFELALNQPQTAYKVRHLKAGIHLASLLFCTSVEIIDKLLAHDVPKLLLQLMDQPFMTLPVKLLILKALDTATNTKKGFCYFLEGTLEFPPPITFPFSTADGSDGKPVDEGTASITGYQKLLESLLSEQLTRAVVAISALMEKFHLYEILKEFQTTIDSMAQNSQVKQKQTSEGASSSEIRLPSGGSEGDSFAHSSLTTWEHNAHVIMTCLDKITLYYQEAWRKLAQPKRYLPARAEFEFRKSPFNPYPGLLRIFKDSHLLENILFLLLCPPLVSHMGVMQSVRNLIMELLHSHTGMLYLLIVPDTINGIHKVLLQSIDETREDDNLTHNLGMHIVYHLQALLYVDGLLQFHSRTNAKKELDDPEAVSALHHMYTMIFSPFGRSAVVDVLSSDSNLSAMLSFLQVTGEEEIDAKMPKSVCSGYATELLMLTIFHSENVMMLEKFCEIISNISQQECTPKLHDLSLWISSVKKVSCFNHEAVPILTSIVKSHLEDAASLPPELITAVRMLKYLCIPQDQASVEHKYMYATIQLFANEGLSYFGTVLQNICDTYMKPSHQSVAFVGIQGVLTVALVKSVTSLIRNILGYLISCRKTEFKDLTAVPVLLQTYSLMALVPPSSFSFSSSHAVQEEIIEALLTYTQPFLGPEESEEALSKSLWTQMMQEVLKYVQQSPRTFTTGLSILSELLPLPLPFHTREALQAAEINHTINHRKLWSAHLHSASGMIQEIIQSFSGSSSHPLQQLLRRFCIQVADLSAPSALVVIRAVLDALLETLEAESKEATDSSGSAASSSITIISPRHSIAPCTFATSRILNLISYLVSTAVIKIPMMHVLCASTKSDEKYSEVLSLMLNLLNLPSEKSTHIQSQECIVSFLQSLCDPDIGFVALDNEMSVVDVLSSCLPAKEHMVQICGALVQHCVNNNHQYASILPALRSLVMLTEHDYGFYHVKIALEQHPEVLVALFGRLSSSFSKDSNDCLSTLSTALEFLRLMVNGYEEGAQTGRSMLLQPSELASLLSYQSPGEKVKSEKEPKKAAFYPLLQLEKFLSETANDEEAVESLLESVSSLLLLLNEGSAKEENTENKELVEPILPPPEGLSNQFASRPVYIFGEVEEDRLLIPAYWLSIPVSEDTDNEQEQAPADFIFLSEKYISGNFDPKATLEMLCSSVDSEADLKKEKSLSFGGKRKYSTLVNTNSTDGNVKRPFIAPMRGRGFSRATSHSTRANDPFRSRPPNTSRPPSMHVDDFLALESNHPGANAAPQQKRMDGTRGRGRGFDRSQAFPAVRGGSGGRFFSPPGPYGRREPNNRGGSRGASRISNSVWGNRANANVLKSPGSIGMRMNFGNRPSPGERGNYGPPFAPPDHRASPQHGRDLYSDAEISPGGGCSSNAGPLRFSRGIRGSSGLGPPVPGHWQETRNKAQNQRFMSGGAGRGGGRRDLNGRHARAFTR